MDNLLTSASIHRFRDYVAIHVNEAPTIYLSVAQAEQLASLLREYSVDVGHVAFTDSALPTQEVTC